MSIYSDYKALTEEEYRGHCVRVNREEWIDEWERMECEENEDLCNEQDTRGRVLLP